MITIPIKPLSVNQAWQGRRFKSPAYKSYAKNVSLMLPKSIDMPDGRLQIHFIFYLSNKASDWDNPIKPIQDIICEKYGINDSRIYFATIEKIIVPKGLEKIEFKIEDYCDA